MMPSTVVFSHHSVADSPVGFDGFAVAFLVAHLALFVLAMAVAFFPGSSGGLSSFPVSSP